MSIITTSTQIVQFAFDREGVSFSHTHSHMAFLFYVYNEILVLKNFRWSSFYLAFHSNWENKASNLLLNMINSYRNLNCAGIQRDDVVFAFVFKEKEDVGKMTILAFQSLKKFICSCMKWNEVDREIIFPFIWQMMYKSNEWLASRS